MVQIFKPQQGQPSDVGDRRGPHHRRSSTMPPSTMPPSTMPPSTMPPSTMPPSTIQPSTMPPSTGMPSTVWPIPDNKGGILIALRGFFGFLFKNGKAEVSTKMDNMNGPMPQM